MTARKGGRPSRYTPKLGAEICVRLATGESLRHMCKSEAKPSISTVMRWLFDPLLAGDPRLEFREHYARARQAQAEYILDEILDIADDGSNDWRARHDEKGQFTGYEANGEAIQRSRLRVDARKWIIAKLLPRYADRLVHEGDQDKPIKLEMDDRELARRVAHILTRPSATAKKAKK